MAMQLFTINATRGFGEQVAIALGMPLANHEERELEDGEHKSRPSRRNTAVPASSTALL